MSTNLCRRGLHDLSEPGARIKDGRCRPCNAEYHREWRLFNPQNRQPVVLVESVPGLWARLRAAVGL